MRNCFVPGCDAYCKKHNLIQRKMFLSPVKLLEQWSEVLPNKRSFKKHDRVCERHFDKNDIIQYWEVNINGQIHLTPRDKPKLRENAVPCQNLPSKDETEEDTLKTQTNKIQVLSQKIIVPAKRTLERRESIRKSIKKQKTTILVGRKVKAEKEQEVDNKGDKADEQQTTIQTKTELELMPEIITEQTNIAENTQENLDAFESIYDEAFDVTLPNLLWGIHRDPERKFIVFSEFNQSIMTSSKLLHISDSCHCKTFLNNELKLSKNLHHKDLTTDSVSTMLDELDKTPATFS